MVIDKKSDMGCLLSGGVDTVLNLVKGSEIRKRKILYFLSWPFTFILIALWLDFKKHTTTYKYNFGNFVNDKINI